MSATCRSGSDPGNGDTTVSTRAEIASLIPVHTSLKCLPQSSVSDNYLLGKSPAALPLLWSVPGFTAAHPTARCPCSVFLNTRVALFGGLCTPSKGPGMYGRPNSPEA